MKTPEPLKARSTESGSVMIIVLAFIIVIGLVTAAILNQTTTNLRASSVTDEVTSRVATAAAGVDLAIQNIRRDPSICVPGPIASPLSINGRTVTSTCEVTNGTLNGIGGRAVHISGAPGLAGGIVVNGSGTPNIVGGAYLSGAFQHAPDASLHFSNGNVLVQQSTPCPPSLPGWVSVSGAPIFGAACTTPISAPPADLPPYPAADWANAQSPNGLDIGSCRVFSPGRYDSPPQLRPNTYFISGVYYFDFDDVINVPAFSTVIGGRPSPGESSQLGVSPCSTLGPTGGVQWIFGRGSRLAFGESFFNIEGSTLELYTLLDPSTGVAQPTIHQVTATAGGYTESTVDSPATLSSSATPARSLLSIRTGLLAGNGVAIHGAVIAPTAQIDVSSSGGIFLPSG
ncbi:MAG: hypothetical protein AB7V43_19025, partial [Acidimicrobiia bacterium]